MCTCVCVLCICVSECEFVCVYLCVLFSQYMLNVHVLDIKSSL